MVRISECDNISPDMQKGLEEMMPTGVPPLSFFKTLARNPRVLSKLKASNFLDRGMLSLREREIIIARTTALSGAEYEWGVHIAFFSEKVQFSPDQIQSLASGNSSDGCWDDQERLLLEICEELHSGSTIQPLTFDVAKAFWTDAEIIEIVAVAGYYKMISCLVNTCKPSPEPYAIPFPTQASNPG